MARAVRVHEGDTQTGAVQFIRRPDAEHACADNHDVIRLCAQIFCLPEVGFYADVVSVTVRV